MGRENLRLSLDFDLPSEWHDRLMSWETNPLVGLCSYACSLELFFYLGILVRGKRSTVYVVGKIRSFESMMEVDTSNL